MKIDAYYSGSHGNCYRLTGGNSTLLLEAGVKIHQVQQAVHYKLASIDGVLLSHEHGDHSHAIKALVRRGVKVYTSAGTATQVGLYDDQYYRLEAMKQYKIGEFAVVPFATKHDAAEPLGFYIAHGADRLVFATDTYNVPNTFKQVTYWMLECNYSEPILRRNLDAGKTPKTLAKRLLTSHFSLENLLRFLSKQDLSYTKKIYLLHTSQDNGDPEVFERRVMQATGKPVQVCGI